MNFVKNTLVKYQNGLNDKSWNALFVENHDVGRCINKFGSLDYRNESAKAIAIMNYFLKGQAARLILNYIFCQNNNQPNSHRILLGTQILL